MLDDRLVTPYIRSIHSIVSEMTGYSVTEAIITDDNPLPEDMEGICAILSFSGKIKGRFSIFLPKMTAFVMAESILGEPTQDPKDHLLLAIVSEMSNIIAGDGNTVLNNSYTLSLRLAPPIVFTGSRMRLFSTQSKSVCIRCESDAGPFQCSIAFVGGIDE